MSAITFWTFWSFSAETCIINMFNCPMSFAISSERSRTALVMLELP